MIFHNGAIVEMVGEKVKALMELHNINQIHLAKLLGKEVSKLAGRTITYNQSWISRMLSNDWNLNVVEVQALAKIFSTTTTQLLGNGKNRQKLTK